MTKRAVRRLAIPFLGALALLTASGILQQPTNGARAENAAVETTKNWLRALRVPGTDHDRMNALVGTWTTTIRQWKSPNAEPVELTGSATRRWVLGDRFIEERAENTTSSGGTLRSLAYLGYNRLKQLYEHLWMLNSATAMFTERGRYDPDTNTFRTTGVDTEPVTGAAILTETELKIQSPERNVLSAYVTGVDGIRWKQLEITYIKK